MNHQPKSGFDLQQSTDAELFELLARESETAASRIYELDSPTRVDTLELPENGIELALKREDLSHVHSYKWRGAFNKIKSMHESGFSGNLVAASAGNHAQGVAIAAARLQLPATIFMPLSTPLLKQDSVKQFGGSFVEIRLCGDTFEGAALEAEKFTTETGGVFIPPYDDLHVIAGQSTIAREIIESGLEPTHAFLQIGGGGMAAGVAFGLRQRFPNIKLIGVEAENQHSMKLSIEHGSRTKLNYVDRFCDGTAVSIPGKLTFRICAEMLDDCITVSNDEVCEAIQYLWQKLRLIVETSGAIGVAAAMKLQFADTDRPLAILSGSNVDFLMLPKIAMRGQAQRPETRYYAFEIGEQPGTLVGLLEQFEGNMNIIDFQYGQVHLNEAYPVIGIEVPHNALPRLEALLAQPQIPKHTEVTGSPASEFRVIPFTVDLLKLPFFAIVEFPNRPGALRDFMRSAGQFASVCYMNYQDTGQTEGTALMGFDFESLGKQSGFFEWLAESNQKFQVIDLEVVRHFTGSTNSPRSWKDVPST
jgi:threonine dehydratase